MKKAIDILYAAGKEGAEISLKGDDLNIRVPKAKTLSKSLIEDIRNNKQSIIEVLRSNLAGADKDEKRITKADKNQSSDTPLSFSQERLWFVHQMEGSRQYHLTSRLLLKGKLNIEALTYALSTVVERHEVLRTILLENNGKPYQHVIPSTGWQMIMVDVSRVGNPEEEINKLVSESDSTPFDLAKDYMFRASLFKVSDEEHQLMITMHHVAADAWSFSIIVQEVTLLYQGFQQKNTDLLPPLPLQFSDFAIWERSYLRKEVLDAKLNYWKNKLKNVQPLQLPTDFARPAVRGTQGASVKAVVNAEVTQHLIKLANQQGCTLYILLMAVYKVLLYRYTNQSDIAVGASLANRSQEDIKALVGFFVNTLTFRSQVDSNESFIDLLQQVKQTNLEAYQHSDVPFEKVVEAVLNERDPSRSPVFQVMLVFNNTPKASGIVAGDLVISEVDNDVPVAKFDFTFFVSENNGQLFIKSEYNKELFKKETMQGMLSHFIALLNSVVKAPNEKVGKLKLMSEAEEKIVLDALLAVNTPLPTNKSVVDLFEVQVVKTPGATAVVFENMKLTFSDLNSAANKLAHLLQSKIKKQNIPIPVFIQRNENMVVAMLGILKAGHAYVPIEVDMPESRLQFLLEDLASPVIVSVSNESDKLEAFNAFEVIELDDEMLQFQPSTNLDVSVSQDQLAYVIYTSGSTGKPKGVMVEHGNLVDYVLGLDKTIGVGTSASYALVSSFATDLGNTVIFSSLLLGGSLHIISKQNVSSSNYLVQYFKNYAIDCLKIVPSHYKALCNETLLLPNKFLIFGGEALPTQLVKRIISARPSCKIINHYGPTETTIGKLLHVVDTEAQYGQTIPLGMPFSNTGVVIMSNDMQVCPAGIPGQLFIAGAGVARGYLNNEELTNQKFINYPVNNSVVRMYATGDLVKALHTGAIEFIGRLDDQVKIRGYRVELGEIENILRQCNGVELCAVIAKEDKGGEKKLVAYVTSNGSISTHNIEQYLQAALPDYMVPGAIIELDEMPLMINGKIDKKALPDPDMQQNATTGFVAPDTEVELRMAAIWCDILEEEIIGVHDDFFALGGHSLLAVRLISAIRKEFKIEIPISHVFDFPTIALLAAELNNQTDVNLLPPVMVVVNKPKLLPLSFSQERLWFIDKLQGSIQYHIPAVLSIKGSLNIPALQFALQSIVNRHEVLRTIFLEQNGQPYQKVKDGGKWHLLLKDGKDFLGNKNLLRHYVQEIINKAFDLSIDDMLRAELISLNSEEFVLVITVHHIASDGWSRSVLVKECEELYNTFSQDNRVTLAPLLVQYSDYAIWQRNYLEGNELDKKVKYWKNALAGMEPLNLPVDFARLPIQSTKGAVYNFIIDNELSHSLNRLSTQNGATNFMLMLAAFKLLLRGYTGQADICVGTPVAGRQQQELEGLIGFFVNTLALRTNLTSANNFIEVLSLVKQTTMSAYEHQDLPFEKVVEAVVENRDLSRTPIFQVLFGMQNTPAVAAVHLQNLEVKQEPIEHATSKFDLGITLLETETGICASVEYCPDLFRKETIEQIMRHYRQLLSEIVRLPDQNLSKIKMLTEAEHQQLIVNGLGRQTTYQKDKMLIHMFEEQVNKTPDNVAVVFNEGRFTYRQLNESANQLAHYLQSKGVTADTLVPICIDRSVEMIVGILGIMKAGGAYVPIDPSYPQERVQFILGDTCAKLVISDSVSKVHLPEQSVVEVIEVGGGQEYLQQQPTHNPAVTATIQSLAYIIYTSGSTGQPKGVKVKHSSLVNYLVNSKTNYVDPSSNNTGSYIHLSFTFDASITALFMPLLAGKSVVISSTEGVNVFEDENFLAYAPYDFLKVTPAHLELLKCIEVNTEEGWITNKLVVGGEALYPSQFNHFYNQDIEVEVINEYGPTEATVGCIVFNFKTVRDYHQIQNGIPIGKPIDNTSIYILDKANNLVPKGAAGEICISGQGLAQGYVNRDDLNAEKFIEHSFVEGVTTRIYKTGDYGRWLTDGNIEYIGRQDDQVKIMGYRVELGEIENTILQSGMINQASVITKSDKENNKRLIAYIVCKKGFDANNIKEHCKVVLPKYMQPASWVTIDHMPLTISGKIDRKALPAFDFAEMATANDVGPQTDTEIKLVNIWKELLAIEKVGVNNSFFELGGHSLMVMRMVSAIKKQFSLAVPIPVLFQFTTIKELGEYLDWQLNTVANEPSETLEVINL